MTMIANIRSGKYENLLLLPPLEWDKPLPTWSDAKLDMIKSYTAGWERIKSQFKYDALSELGLPSSKVMDRMFDIAWDWGGNVKGHGKEGLEVVYNLLVELVGLESEIIKEVLLC